MTRLPPPPRRRLLLAVASVLALPLVAGCATADAPGAKPPAAAPAMAVVTGSIILRERTALPPGAEIVVRLFDASGREEVMVAETRIPAGGRQSPMPFELRVDTAKVQPDMSYLLRAQILVAGMTRFVTGTRITVRPLEPPAALLVLVVPGDTEANFNQGNAPARASPPPAPRPPQQRPGRRTPPTAPP